MEERKSNCERFFCVFFYPQIVLNIFGLVTMVETGFLECARSMQGHLKLDSEMVHHHFHHLPLVKANHKNISQIQGMEKQILRISEGVFFFYNL